MSSKRKRKMNICNPHGRGKPKPVTVAAWDMGATGPANRDRLREEPATDIDPETGKETPNPNGVRRVRRVSWVYAYAARGELDRHHVAAAEKLRMASEGMRERDPLAAIGEIKAKSGDRAAAMVDARRWFHELWASIPTSSRPVVERVVIDDLPIWSGCGSAAWARHMSRLVAGLDAIP